MLNNLWRGQYLRVRKGFHNRLQAEIEIRIAGGNHDGFQRLATGFNHLHQLFTIFSAELRIKQYRFRRTGY